jgi:hypothetical protein
MASAREKTDRSILIIARGDTICKVAPDVGNVQVMGRGYDAARYLLEMQIFLHSRY